MKFYRGSATAARSYVEADRGRVDDYYLAEGTGLADRLLANASGASGQVSEGGTLDGDAYEAWVAGYQDDGTTKGRLRTDDQALRFVEVVVNGPKTWSLAAAVNPQIATAYDVAQDRAAREIVGWLAEHATTRIGRRGRQVQVPVEHLEAAVVRHHTSRTGDPHRHLHLQINARVHAAGRWRGLHSVGIVDSIEAINGIGHAAIASDPQFRQALADHGYTLHPDTLEVDQLLPYAPGFSARAAQISRNVDRFEAAWRTDHPGQEPGPTLRRTWDRRAWATARPDKVTPSDGTDITRRWLEDLADAGFTPPTPTSPTPHVLVQGTPLERVDPGLVADLVLARLGGRRSAWNAADIRGEVEKLLPTLGVIAIGEDRRARAVALTNYAARRCVSLLDRDDVPAHIRVLTSRRVLEVEAQLIDRLAARANDVVRRERPTLEHSTAGGNAPGNAPGSAAPRASWGSLDHQQRAAAAVLAGSHALVVLEGAAGAGKTTTLAAARGLIERDGHRLVVVTPTLKAAHVAARELGTQAFSAAWLIHQHGYRWDADHHWTRLQTPPTEQANLGPGDVLLVDEAGMLDQDTALALLTIADETGARVALVGDRHQLPAVGRGGVLDHATTWVHPDAHHQLDTVHRFTDPAYADLTLQMRTGEDPGAVFDTLLARGDIVIHPTHVERLQVMAATAGLGGVRAEDQLVIADTHETVTALNAAIRDHRLTHSPNDAHGANTLAAAAAGQRFITDHGELICVGDTIATRRNNRDLDVTNRARWTVTSIDRTTTSITITSHSAGDRMLPAAYALAHVELAHATTVHGAQGETTDHAHFALDETTTAASAYVAMTRGRHHNTAHLVADNQLDARNQWINTFTHDRADLGPAKAAQHVTTDVERYGTRSHTRPRPHVPSELEPIAHPTRIELTGPIP